MKKKGIIICLFCLVTACLFSACGRKENVEEPSLYALNEIELPNHAIDAAESMTNVSKEVPSTQPEETTTEEETSKAKDLSLKTLKINRTALAVNVDEQQYRVPNETTEITITAEARDVMSSVISGAGKHKLETGNNRIEIVVRGSDDSRKTYVVNVVRQEPPTTQPATQSQANQNNNYNYNYNYNYSYTPPQPTVAPNDGVQIIN